MILTVQIETSNPQQWDTYVSNLVQSTLKTELAKKKHKLGEVTVCQVWKQDSLDRAAWHFAREIREAASEAVNERIR